MLNISNSLLVIIDIQDKLVQATKYGLEVVNNMAKVATTANILSIPTIITEQYPQGLGNTIQTIKTASGRNAKYFEKTSFNALDQEKCKNEIMNTERKQIIIGGIETHICVLQTVDALIKDGYEVYVLKDCCASRKKEEYKTGIDLMRQYGAKITSTEIVLFEWLKTSLHPNFKEIQSLIK
jgi:nicotinamidase-related amidase